MRSLLLSLLALLLGTLPLSAQRGPDRAMWKKMNLTEQQAQAIKDIRAQSQKQMIDLRAMINKHRVDLRTLREEDSPDRATFERLSREIADLQVRQKLLLFDADQAIITQLDEAQQQQWKSIKQSRGQRLERGMRAFGRGLRDRDDHD